MDFLKDIFNWGYRPAKQPDVAFGRYSDLYKSKEQQDSWDKAAEQFEAGERVEAFRQFFFYLADTQQENVVWSESEGKFQFEIQQGSRKVVGSIDENSVRAASLLARADVTNVGFMRRLMEYNFSLKYSRFGLSPENVIAIKFDSNAVDCSPLKLYNGLKEMAVHADKQDDLLLDEFQNLVQVEPLVGTEIPESEKEVKYNFVQKEIREVFEFFEKAKPDPNQYPGGYAYLNLHLAYKLDYLVRPEGFMMETLEKAHRAFFNAGEDKNAQLKNMAMHKEFQKLLDRPKAEFFKEMYRTRSTFGITAPVTHDRLASLIEGELPNMDWYLENKHHTLALAVPSYIVGYALFNYAMPLPDKQLLHLYFQILEPAFFRDLGFELPYYSKVNHPDLRAIKRAIGQIVEANRAQFPKLKPDVSRLDFGSPALFAKSFLSMVKDLDLTKAD